ncbi:MAG: cold shock domain-containing protein [Balneolaceae bacterium]|nr:cold shock domain-containing protein [Balneolaceae bacterium]
MSQQVTTKFFDSQKGFGFINIDDGSEDIFVHRNNVQNIGYDQGF